MTSPPPTAAQITRASKSNLAFALLVLPRERRGDMRTFYAFCRTVDDLADEPGLEPAARREGLETWRRAVEKEVPGEPPLASDVRALIAKYTLPVAHFHEIIAGCEMDLEPAIYETWEELRIYCHRVASVVGLVSIEIFGCRDPRCREYAEQLGLALQLTNILRDVAEDYRNGGRIYLPRVEMDAYGCNVAELTLGVRDAQFLALMDFQTRRARALYDRAIAALPAGERRTLVAAEIMRTIYSRLLEKMRRDRFRVFEKRYTLSPLEKLVSVAEVLVRSRRG